MDMIGPVEGNNEVPLISPERAEVIYTVTQDSLEELSRLDLGKFLPVANTETITSEPVEFTEIAEILGWGLRVADSFNNQELVRKVQEAIASQPSYEYFVVYQLLTDAFEAEGGYLIDQDFRLNPVSDRLRRYIMDVLNRHVAEIIQESEWKMLTNILARVTAWLPQSSVPETYINLYDVKSIFEAIDRRQEMKPVSDPDAKADLEWIAKYRASIDHYFRENQGARLH